MCQTSKSKLYTPAKQSWYRFIDWPFFSVISNYRSLEWSPCCESITFLLFVYDCAFTVLYMYNYNNVSYDVFACTVAKVSQNLTFILRRRICMNCSVKRFLSTQDPIMGCADLRNACVLFQWREIFWQTNAYSCLCSASLTVRLLQQQLFSALP